MFRIAAFPRTKLFDIEAQVIRVCEGGRSAYVQGRDKRGQSGDIPQEYKIHEL